MVCPKCGSQNVNIQVVSSVHLVDKHKGCLWWCIVGWWWVPIKWLVFTVPALFAKIFIPKKQRTKNKERKVCVCQQCGKQWNL